MHYQPMLLLKQYYNNNTILPYIFVQVSHKSYFRLHNCITLVRTFFQLVFVTKVLYLICNIPNKPSSMLETIKILDRYVARILNLSFVNVIAIHQYQQMITWLEKIPQNFVLIHEMAIKSRKLDI